MKRKTWIEKFGYNRTESPEIEQAFFFATLLFSAAFAAVLFSSSAEIFALDVENRQPPAQAPWKSSLERTLGKMVAGHPMEDMVPFIAKQDPMTATFLVSIAKQESNWGKYSPKDEDGRECYNYWGYRGQTEFVTPSGYSCFRTPKEAVKVVGKRLNRLIFDYELDTPKELLVWKCGSSCAGHDQADVARWQNTVGMYSEKIERESSL
ncbi:MAG: glucosaminidase domain-containing protein [Candidatus Moranbacteria bacterium]|nr:glucosaminidase domain-containing protein [Candidatus Moranbacteria bacterium]